MGTAYAEGWEDTVKLLCGTLVRASYDNDKANTLLSEGVEILNSGDFSLSTKSRLVQAIPVFSLFDLCAYLRGNID